MVEPEKAQDKHHSGFDYFRRSDVGHQISPSPICVGLRVLDPPGPGGCRVPESQMTPTSDRKYLPIHALAVL